MPSLIDRNIRRDRDGAAPTGIDPYKPLTEEDEGFPGWFGTAILALIVGVVSILAFLLETGDADGK